jgi:AcrR family transcriptional regulator
LYKQFVRSFNTAMAAHPSAPPKNRSRAAAHNRPDRRAAILLAAEKLFAEHGYHAVSIRQIALEAAGAPGPGGYYYGQKHELFHAIFAHWRGTIDARMDLLREAQASPPDSGTPAAHRRGLCQPRAGHACQQRG